MAECIDKPNNLPDIQYVLGPDDLDSSKIQESLKLIEIEYDACYKYCIAQAVEYTTHKDTRAYDWTCKANSYKTAWEWIQSEAEIITQNTTGSQVKQTAKSIGYFHQTIQGLKRALTGAA